MLNWQASTLLALAAVSQIAASPVRRDEGNSSHPWMTTGLSSTERANLLIANLTLDEKFTLVEGGVSLEGLGIGGVLNACIGSVLVPNRTGLPELCMGDGPEGVSNGISNVTTFPAPTFVSSSFDEDLAFRYGLAISKEHTAKGRNVILAPTINIQRTPLWGRTAESLSEDPYLTGRIAIGLVKGIQNLSAIACPKHFAAYNQEINRFGDGPWWNATNVIVSNRTLNEVYYPAFKAVVEEAQPGAVMTSYNQVNGHFASENVHILSDLRSWGFNNGFTVSDWYFGIRSTVPSVIAGLDISMPGGDLANFGFEDFYGASALQAAIDAGEISTKNIDTMSFHVLEPMFRLGLVDSPIVGDVSANVRTSEAHDFAAEVVEKGAILLKNQDNILPFKNVSKIAIIGKPANSSEDVTELHGGFVLDVDLDQVLVTPLAGFTQRAAKDGISVTYTATSPRTERFEPVPMNVFQTSAGEEGLNATYWQNSDWSGDALIQVVDSNITNGNYPGVVNITYPNFFSSKWRGKLIAPESGVYLWSVFGGGLASVRIDGDEILHIRKDDFTIVEHGNSSLTKGQTYDFEIDYSGAPSLSTGSYGLSLGWVLPSESEALLSQAQQQAIEADVAIVFVSDAYTEGGDRRSLDLTSRQSELISDIASKSSKTVVVINDNGPVLMPWLDKVDSVVYGWYAGEAAGTALARLLFGDVNFSGKTPITFPPSNDVGPATTEKTYPGPGGDSIGEAFPVYYDEGLLVGYKWFEAKDVKPLFPFGYGLSYTTFYVSGLTTKTLQDAKNFSVTGKIENTGEMSGSDVVQLYVAYPESAEEPPKLLKRFAKISLEAGASQNFSFTLSAEKDLQYFDEDSNGWKLASGTYKIYVGTSSDKVELAGEISL